VVGVGRGVQVEPAADVGPAELIEQFVRGGWGCAASSGGRGFNSVLAAPAAGVAVQPGQRMLCAITGKGRPAEAASTGRG